MAGRKVSANYPATLYKCGVLIMEGVSLLGRPSPCCALGSHHHAVPCSSSLVWEQCTYAEPTTLSLHYITSIVSGAPLIGAQADVVLCPICFDQGALHDVVAWALSHCILSAYR
jgi:hypothetical protein